MYIITQANFYMLVILYIITIVCMGILIGYNFKYRSYVKDSIYRDSLTGVYNRKYGDRQIWKAYDRNLKERFPLGIVMTDIDNFKIYNDSYGHLHGDNALRCVAQSILKSSDSKCVVYRYGGEEFIVICYNAKIEEMEELAERIRIDTKDLNKDKENDLQCELTLSIGIAIDTKMEKNIDTLIMEADVSLYESKNKGKDRVTIYETLPIKRNTKLGK